MRASFIIAAVSNFDNKKSRCHAFADQSRLSPRSARRFGRLGQGHLDSGCQQPDRERDPCLHPKLNDIVWFNCT
jgi:hypothetical protein